MSQNASEEKLFSTGKVAAMLGLLLAIEFVSVLFGGKTFYFRDFGVMGYPATVFFRDSIWRGEIPLWNPYSNCGAPYLAQWGTMVLYPLNLIYLILPLPWSLNFFCLFHLWIGGMGMYLLARRWVQRDWPAALASVIFAFNGITLGSLTWPNYTVAIGLFPWIVYFVERAWQPSLDARTVCCAGAVSALQLLAGAPELSLFTWIFLTAFWLLRLFNSSGERKVIFFRHLCVLLVAFGLSAVQLLPFFQLLENSQRAAGPLAEKWPLPPWGWANFILPRFHTFKMPQGDVGMYDQFFLSSTYIGAASLVFGGCAFLRTNPRVWILAALVIGAAIMSLGSAGYLYPILVKSFPLLGIARYPIKFLFLLSFALPLLAAFGALNATLIPRKELQRFLSCSAFVLSVLMLALVWFNYKYPMAFDRWAEFRNNSIVRWIFFLMLLGCAYSAFTLSQTRARTAALAGTLFLLFLDGTMHLETLNPTIRSTVLAGEMWSGSHRQEKPEHGKGRAFITPEAEMKFLRSFVADPEQDMIGKRLAVWSHWNLPERVPKVNGSSTLQMREQAKVQTWLYSTTNQNREAWLDFLNVTLQTSPNSAVEWQPRTNAMPFITGGQKALMVQPGLSIEALTEKFDLRNEVLISSEETSGNNAALERSQTKVEITGLRVSARELAFDTRSSAPSYVVISQSWHPAWACQVNNQSSSVLRANFAFQAIAIPAGESRVRVYYRDTGFWLGSLISGATLLVCGFLASPKKKNTLLNFEKSVPEGEKNRL